MKKKGLCLGLILSLLTVWGAPAGAAEIAGIDIHGFISQGYLQSTDNNYLANTDKGTFEFNEAAINFSKLYCG